MCDKALGIMGRMLREGWRKGWETERYLFFIRVAQSGHKASFCLDKLTGKCHQ